MEKVLYIVNNKKTQNILNDILKTNNLCLCYDKKGEQIYRNDDLLVSRHKKYNVIYCYNENIYKNIQRLLKENNNE